jgi:TonB family protein
MRFKNPVARTAGPYSVSLNWSLDGGEENSPYARRIPDATRGINRTNPGELPKERRVNLGLYLDVTSDGTVAGCDVRWSSGVKLLDERACVIASNWRYQPLLGEAVIKPHREIETFFFADPAAPVPTRKSMP